VRQSVGREGLWALSAHAKRPSPLLLVKSGLHIVKPCGLENWRMVTEYTLSRQGAREAGLATDTRA
jgi:hypothetical protein